MTREKLGLSILFVITAGIFLGIFCIPNFVGNGMTKSVRQRMKCQSNLRYIDAAKQLWAEAVHAPSNATPTWDDLKPYLSHFKGVVPTCPSRGVYTIGPLTIAPACSVKGHVIE
jgi:hypothetical protein